MALIPYFAVMQSKERWVDLALINLCLVAFLGFILRSKILFAMPFIDYNRLLNAHSHFAFDGWLSLALMTLFIFELLPDSKREKLIYKLILSGVVLASYAIVAMFPFEVNAFIPILVSTFFILLTYIFGYFFIKDIRKTEASKTVKLLSISSVACLILSSAGTLTLDFLFASKALNVVLYRDALYTYLHLQYNGFFTLAVFALLFHKFETKISTKAKKTIFRFSVILVLSILPSMFLTYLWSGPNLFFQLIGGIGSILLLMTFGWFIVLANLSKEIYRTVNPLIRFMMLLSLAAFMLKIFLQSFLSIDFFGNPIFGDRPAVMAFLHLVFLGFVSLFLLAYFAQERLLNIKSSLTKFALVTYTAGVAVNEILLWLQGLGAIFIKSSYLFPWLLWLISIWLLAGTVLILIARTQSKGLSFSHHSSS